MRLLLLPILLATAAGAQTGPPVETGTIAGTVTDAEVGEPLPFAAVLLPGLDRRTTTDVGGRFSFDGIPEGTHTLEVRYVGYDPAAVRVAIGASRSGGWTQRDATASRVATVQVGMQSQWLCEVFIVHGFEQMSRGVYGARVASYHAQRGPHAPWGDVPCEAWEEPDPSPRLHARTR